MCAAEIEINRRLAPEIYLGTAAVWRGGDGKLALGRPPHLATSFRGALLREPGIHNPCIQVRR